MRTLVLATVVALAGWSCGAQPAGTSTPVSPTTVSPAQIVNYAGEWDVTTLQTLCEPASRYACPRPPIAPAHQTLRLMQLGSHVTGLLNGDDVQGDVDADGHLRLTGRDVIAEFGGTWELTSFDVSLTANGGLEGQMSTSWWIPENFEPLGGTHRATFTVQTASRGALPASFSGRWLGNFQTQGCVAARCAGPAKEFELRLEDTGGLLTGFLVLRLNERVPVAGVASGDIATFTSASSDASAPFRLTDMRVQRSAAGRLTGQFAIERPRVGPEALELVKVSLEGVPR